MSFSGVEKPVECGLAVAAQDTARSLVYLCPGYQLAFVLWQTYRSSG